MALLEHQLADKIAAQAEEAKVPAMSFITCTKGHKLQQNTGLLKEICKGCGRRYVKGYWECKGGCSGFRICALCQHYTARRARVPIWYCKKNHNLVFGFAKPKGDIAYNCFQCKAKLPTLVGRWYCPICEVCLCVGCQKRKEEVCK